jgi:hypothetical protein
MTKFESVVGFTIAAFYLLVCGTASAAFIAFIAFILAH